MSSYTRSPLKWAGGKFRLLPRLLEALPPGKRLVEPFMGSGVLFLNTDYPAYLLCDTNKDLIAFFRALFEGGSAFIDACAAHFTEKANTSEIFYENRAAFNTLPHGEERAALFLYLNRHAYNGLIRYNSKGKFNTPFGRYLAPYFPRREMQAMHAKAQQVEVTLLAADFRESFARLQSGDVVYCDPPYVALSATANFTAYTKAAFSAADQADLSACAARAGKNGNPVLLSNHDTEFAREIYKNARLISFPVQRFISCKGKQRHTAQELLTLFP